MNIYLRHFIPGTKIAISEAEALADENEGWVRYNSLTETKQNSAPVVNELEVKRRGRPKSTE